MIQEFLDITIVENPTTSSFSRVSLNHLQHLVTLKLKEDNFITWKNVLNPIIQ